MMSSKHPFQTWSDDGPNHNCFVFHGCVYYAGKNAGYFLFSMFRPRHSTSKWAGENKRQS